MSGCCWYGWKLNNDDIRRGNIQKIILRFGGRVVGGVLNIFGVKIINYRFYFCFLFLLRSNLYFYISTFCVCVFKVSLLRFFEKNTFFFFQLFINKNQSFFVSYIWGDLFICLFFRYSFILLFFLFFCSINCKH